MQEQKTKEKEEYFEVINSPRVENPTKPVDKVKMVGNVEIVIDPILKLSVDDGKPKVADKADALNSIYSLYCIL